MAATPLSTCRTSLNRPRHPLHTPVHPPTHLPKLTYLPTYLATYRPTTYLPTYLLTYLPTYSRKYQPTNLATGKKHQQLCCNNIALHGPKIPDRMRLLILTVIDVWVFSENPWRLGFPFGLPAAREHKRLEPSTCKGVRRCATGGGIRVERDTGCGTACREGGSRHGVRRGEVPFLCLHQTPCRMYWYAQDAESAVRSMRWNMSLPATSTVVRP